MINYSRRKFMKMAGTGLMICGIPAGISARTFVHRADQKKDTFTLAIAGYTFAKFNLDDSLAMMRRVNINCLALKDFHLPLDSTTEVINQTLAKIKAAGVKLYGAGPIYMKTEAEVDRAFDYTKKVEAPLLVGVPNYELLPYVEKKVKEYDIRLAIHNHGPDMDLYPSVDNIWENISKMDPRMGICMDIGHTVRLGLDPVSSYLKYKERIFDIHTWDADKPEKKGWCVEAGRGIIDFPKFFSALRRAGYSGTCSLEYAKDMSDPLAGIAESIGYFKGVLDALSE